MKKIFQFAAFVILFSTIRFFAQDSPYSWLFSGWKIPYSIALELNDKAKSDEKAEAVLKKAIQNLGGEKYLSVKTQIGKGKFSIIRGGTVSFQSFIDVIVFPDKERTDFKQSGIKSVQTNVGNSGWLFDGDNGIVKVQTEAQIANFKRGIRTSLDSLLHGYWRGNATLTYVGRRPSSLGKRNEVLKLAYKDGFSVEFEFAAEDGLPMKATHKRTNPDNEEVTEEDRYAQFVDINGVKTPFIIDRFTNGVQTSRINYESVEFNRNIPDSIFKKPSSAKEAKKDIKL